MERMQVQFTEEQLEEVRRLSAERGTSGAAIVREAVDAYTARSKAGARRSQLLEAAGCIEDGAGAAEDHDRFLGDAFLA